MIAILDKMEFQAVIITVCPSKLFATLNTEMMIEEVNNHESFSFHTLVSSLFSRLCQIKDFVKILTGRSSGTSKNHDDSCGVLLIL